MSFADIWARARGDALSAIGESIQHTPVGSIHGGPDTQTVTGVFESRYVEVLGVESQRPTVELQTSDVPNAKHGDTVERDGALYKVVNVQRDPDGVQGLTLLVLEAQ